MGSETVNEKLAVIALGGNSIRDKGQRGTVTEQFA
ncbi:MAG: carbamate kinase, partial [Spirochaetaceae bacterium]